MESNVEKAEMTGKAKLTVLKLEQQTDTLYIKVNKLIITYSSINMHIGCI